MKSGKLFDVLPESFFHPLAAKSKVVYWDCICRLYRIMNAQLSFGVERDVLVDELTFYFDSDMSADFEEDEEESTGSSRDKANLMLRKLERYGWIYVDVDYNYVQRINFRDYAIRVIKSLLSLEEEKKPEYQGYVYTIYTLTKAGTEQAGVALLQIAENTENLITGLKSLNANIKKYIDELTRFSTIAEIMDALLNDYYTNIVDKAYHRLMTSDNVAKYRPEIISSLEAHSRSARYKNAAARDIAQIREISPEEANELVMNLLHSVIDAFRQMDRILEDINAKNSKYQRAAIGRARFLLSSSEDVKGQIRNILMRMNERITERKLDYNAVYELEEMDGLIKLFSGIFMQNHKQVIDELFEKLALDDEDSAKALEFFTDYRSYMDYDIKISLQDGNYMLYSKVSQEKSGGETQTPFYITVAASFIQLYKNSIGGDAIGLIMMDEAFNNMDDDRMSGVLEFLTNSNLQIVIAAPPEKIQYIGSYMEKILLVMQAGRNSFIEPYEKIR